ncbi:hypothetical protein EJ05DRAFT_471871 [Pseudovirgaria hyperparasitica]|uniref:Uncharacterized protein n=1 Tax=Pseudovirgaria hyperparasitica TaxID=470096 RepID=A0A6A6WLM8_9PEZI|nr:uncharacterized protein EJ05DRAFT_471871 [Pseudovirgaria hyperparasitica]KAF2762909.1 hypothetical protein EJ05DRAFT_471871 [Pseudovirgaria hyperparasitica]
MNTTSILFMDPSVYFLLFLLESTFYFLQFVSSFVLCSVLSDTSSPVAFIPLLFHHA